MRERMFRLLRADEIDVRIGQIKTSSTILLLYKDARVDMDILDETVGPMNWQRRHYLIGDNLHCEVSIWDEGKKCWVSKSDVGVESNTEKEKGEASDSFKGRALIGASEESFIRARKFGFQTRKSNGVKTIREKHMIHSVCLKSNTRTQSYQSSR